MKEKILQLKDLIMKDKKSKTLAKPLSIFVDKLNRKEYLKFSRYELRYKIYSSGMFTLISKEDLQQLPISATKKRLMLKDINLMFYELQEEARHDAV